MGINLRKDSVVAIDRPNPLKLVEIGLVKDQQFLRPGQLVINRTNSEYCRNTVLWVTVTDNSSGDGPYNSIPLWTLTDIIGKIRVCGELSYDGICNSCQENPYLGLHCSYFRFWDKQEVLNWTVYEQKKTLEQKRHNSTKN